MAAAEEIALFRPANSILSQGSQAILRTAYFELGVEMIVEPLQPQDALERSLAGESDSEVSRTYALGERTSVLIRVPTPIAQILTVIATPPGINRQVSSIDELADQRVGILHARQGSAALTDVHPYETRHEMLDPLLAGEVDFALVADISLRVINAELPNAERFQASDPVHHINLYHYLNERHADFVPPVDAILARISSEGALTAIRDTCERECISENFN